MGLCLRIGLQIDLDDFRSGLYALARSTRATHPSWDRRSDRLLIFLDRVILRWPEVLQKQLRPLAYILTHCDAACHPWIAIRQDGVVEDDRSAGRAHSVERLHERFARLRTQRRISVL